MEIPKVSLTIDEEFLVGQNHQGISDGCIAMGMKLHCFTNHVGDFVVAAIAHREKRMQNPTLDRLQSVSDIRDRSVEHHIAGVLEKVVAHQRIKLGHGSYPCCRESSGYATSVSKFSTTNSRRAGVFFPM